MTILFTSIQEDLKSFLASLSIEDLRDRVYATTFYKGKEYYEDGLVSDAQYTFDKSRLNASVHGTLDYKVSLVLQNGSLLTHCNCPVEDLCKHITAVLLYSILESDAIEIAENRATDSRIYQQLQSFSKDELISLLLKNSSEEFLREISNRQASEAEARAIFKKTAAAIRRLFMDTDLLYSPDYFLEAFVKQIRKLLGLEQHLQDELGELIFYVIRQVDDAFNEGHLYEEYSDGSFESPEEFNMLIENYARTLPYAKKTSFFNQLNILLDEASYTTFDSLLSLSEYSFEESELPFLKDMLLKDYQNLPLPITERYYQLVRPLLSAAEKETILLYLKDDDSDRLLELAKLYRDWNRESEAIEIIRSWLSNKIRLFGDEPVLFLYLDLLKSQKQEMHAACMEAINRCPSCRMLEKIAEVSEGNISTHEHSLEKRNQTELLDYLEKKGRLTEALSLIKRSDSIWESRQQEFYRKHKEQFPEDAVQFFCEVVDKNLEYTGNTHYYVIAEALKQIRQIDPAKTEALATDIRTNYYRRRNLMKLLEEI